MTRTTQKRVPRTLPSALREKQTATHRNITMPPKSKRDASKYAEDDDFVVADNAEPETKRAKTKAKPTVAQKETGKKFTDEEGNPYWEVCRLLPMFCHSKEL
jgi:hypothetical protein